MVLGKSIRKRKIMVYWASFIPIFVNSGERDQTELGNNHCGKTRREAFKRRRANQYVLCRREYYERLVASFAHQIKSEYYSGNRSVSNEGIILKNFSAPNTDRNRKNNTHTHTPCYVLILFVWLQQTRFCHNYFTMKMNNWIVEETKHYVCYVKYTMVKHRWLCWALNMFHRITPDVNVVTSLFSYYWPCYHCTSKHQRSGWWNQHHWGRSRFGWTRMIHLWDIWY